MQDIVMPSCHDVAEWPAVAFLLIPCSFRVLCSWISPAGMWVRNRNVNLSWVGSGKFLPDWHIPTEAHLVGVIVKSLRICLPFFGDPFLIVLLSLWRLFWWTMGRRKVVSEDFVRQQRKRQEIGNKKHQKKLYETVYMHQVLRAPNQLMFHYVDVLPIHL